MNSFSSVLLIEDNPGDARLVTEYLGERFGDECEVHGARTLADGLEALRHTPVDLVLLDLSLPDSTGLDTFYRVHAQAPHTPVVILTGDDDDEQASEALRVGAEDYLAKQHADGVALIRTMRHAVQRRRAAETLRDGEARHRPLAETAEEGAPQADAPGGVHPEEEPQRLKAQLEARVAERTAQLEAMNADLEAFNHSVAHDLRTPLNAILGFAAILQEDAAGQLTARHQQHLHFIERSAHSMNELIGGLLSLARVTRYDLALEDLDLSAMAGAIAERLEQEQPQHPARWHIDAGVRGTGDPALMAIVLQNLLHNAWKYTGTTAQPQIRFGRIQAPSAPAAPAVYCVSDNGIGFDMASAGKLFMPFQRLPSARMFSGTGIGLATVRRIIQRHGGRIWAESQPGVSTTFFFTLQNPPAPPGGPKDPQPPPGRA